MATKEKRNFSKLLLIISCIAIIGLVILFIYTKINLDKTNTLLTRAQNDLAVQNNNFEIQSKNVTTLLTQKSDVENELSNLKKSFSAQQSELSTANAQLRTLLCENQVINMDYTSNSIAQIRLQNYVSTLPYVREVSYVIPERIYSNSDSRLYYVTYVDNSTGKVYTHRYIVYIPEFGWSKGTFDMDNQCWLDKP